MSHEEREQPPGEGTMRDEVDRWFRETGVRTPAQENSIEMHIARDWLNRWPSSASPSFLWHFISAAVRADGENWERIVPALRGIIDKYRLRCLCDIPAPRAVYAFDNGMVVVFDANGHQIPALQGRIVDVWPLLRYHHTKDTVWYGNGGPR